MLKIMIKKAPHFSGALGFSRHLVLAGDYSGRTWAFFALSDCELNLLAFVKARIAVGLYFRVMNEQILIAVIGRDESVSFFLVKPFYCTCTHYLSPLAF